MAGKDGGFTLIELAIVMLVVVVLSATVTAIYVSQVNKAKDSIIYAVLGAYRTAYNLYLADNEGIAPSDIGQINVKVGMTNFETEDGSTGTTSSIQMLAGTVQKGGVTSVGYGDFAGKSNVAEMYYDSIENTLYIDGSNGGTDYLDTKGNKWNEY
jgi:prepilin-type N-terminal cleavage/methylation domain-containing protein